MEDKHLEERIVKILLVEDNDDHAELVIRSFENNNASVDMIFRVSDGEEALDFLYKRGKFKDAETPSIIFLDIKLPKIHGLEVLKIIKEDKNLKKIPVVMLTSSHSNADVDVAYSNYANSYITKPLDFEKFNQIMKELNFYWVCWNVNPVSGECLD